MYTCIELICLGLPWENGDNDPDRATENLRMTDVTPETDTKGQFVDI